MPGKKQHTYRRRIPPYKKHKAASRRNGGKPLAFIHCLAGSIFLRVFLIFKNLELISDAPDGLERPFVTRALQLFAKTLDVNVDGAAVSEIVEAPDLVKKLIAGENAVVICREEIEQNKLLRRQIDDLAADLQLILLKRNFKVIELDHFAVGGVVHCISSENGFDTCEYLFHVKRLDDEVVGAELKPQHLVDRFALCGNHYDRLL